MEIAIGSIAAVLVIVMVIALASRRPRPESVNNVSQCNTKDEEVMLI